jgi:hypothetical protein
MRYLKNIKFNLRVATHEGKHTHKKSLKITVERERHRWPKGI